MNQTFDIVICGGGSAGCVVAGRLCELDPTLRVALVEAGDEPARNPEVLRADGYKDAFANDAVIWERFSAPQPGCDDHRLFVGSGRGLGGSGSVNAMVYTRGARADFDAWELDGWRWDDLVEDFAAVERVLRLNRRPPTTMTEVCIEAAEQVGFERATDFNDGRLSGRLGYEWMNYDGDERRSSYVSFLLPKRDHPNLDVMTRTRVQRLLVDGDRVTGVEVHDAEGRPRVLEAKREVVLAAGAIETPKLLLLSGIGPREAIEPHGIRLRHELTGVGANFHDHPNVTLFFRGKQAVDFNYPQLYGFHRANPWTDWTEDEADVCYVFYPARSSFREALVRLLPGIALPQPLYRVDALRQGMREGVKLAFESQTLRDFIARIYGLVVILGKPQSRGSVRLRSASPADEALVDPAYFSDPADMDTMIFAVRHARRIANALPLCRWGNDELMPGWSKTNHIDLERFIRGNAMTTYHFAGTCRMGHDAASVVDTRLRVRGLRGLRIADASVIPTVPVSALNAPSMLIGYRAARFVHEG
ncbi:MAG: GMC family oxidoreductase [Myxococcales bacterium]|nr:GMC family oxidoreductase [Myxococcales bacterium]